MRSLSFWLAVLLATSLARASGQEGSLNVVPIPEGPVVEVQEVEAPSAEIEPTEIIVEDEYGIVMDESYAGEGDYPSCFIDDFVFDFPGWYFYTDAIWLNRTTTGDLSTAEVITNGVAIGSNRIKDSDFGFAPGLRFTLAKNGFDCMTYVEATYFGLNHWKSSVLVGVPPEQIIRSDLDMGLNVGLGNNQTYQTDLQLIDYTSDVHNGELNMRSFFSPNFAVISGIRYMHLSERLSIYEQGNVSTVGVIGSDVASASRIIRTGNNYLGPQLGVDAFWDCTNDIRLSTTGRVSIGANFSESTIRQVADNPSVNTFLTRTQYDEETALSTLVDLSIGLDMLLTRNITLRGGFQFVWLTNVALAPEQQVNTILDPNGLQRQIENGGGMIFFGPYAGLEVSWGGCD